MLMFLLSRKSSVLTRHTKLQVKSVSANGPLATTVPSSMPSSPAGVIAVGGPPQLRPPLLPTPQGAEGAFPEPPSHTLLRLSAWPTQMPGLVHDLPKPGGHRLT